ncbi:hypothetical protein A3D66_02350 [Candidatus Kaiserbacteria bacterium RIFCSPHIGHO2_02_FULL_50_9]|nr:MAG: hypothetical protein A2761_03060 [Candidatus Kaiserbacteria bacterium RIFCSPHIGHO2_01_FULL_51_33]OGG63625.1 MAG: hypothetical protein A3D66_02350 [Candidatus Kaiserbacteria bacterium RIFCSPHIGHO2_02_FULL_50_9]
MYLDYASATPLDPRVLKAMSPYWSLISGNPGALHYEGVLAKRALSDARSGIARLLHAHAPEIIFTGSGTEANNLAIGGTLLAQERRGAPLSGMHIVTSAIEHESVLAPIRELERRGVKVTVVMPEASGIVSAEKIIREILPETTLVSLQSANHEIGTIQPVPEVGKKIREWRNLRGTTLPYFHSDASQAALLLDVSVDRLSVDLMTLDAQKMYGPKGVGALYCREGVALVPVLFGGHQEQGLRPGTENIPAIVGMAAALDFAVHGREREYKRLLKLQKLFFRSLEKKVPEALINGDRRMRLPSNVNLSLPGRDGEMLALALDVWGVAVTTKSACAGSEEKVSLVVRAIGKSEEEARATLRFSFGKGTRVSDIRRVTDALAHVAAQNI